MQLDVLARGDMPDTGRILLGQFCNPAQLIRRQSAERDFNTDHLDTGLPLAINAVLEAEGPEQIARDIARIQAPGLGFEGLDFFHNGRRNGLCLYGNRAEWCATHR